MKRKSLKRIRHRWIDWRRTSNRRITHAPAVLLTGAGASVPLGVADALYSAIGHGRLETKLARPVLTAMISLFIPKMAGARMLSAEMIDGVAITLAERDYGVGGGFIDGLYLRPP